MPLCDIILLKRGCHFRSRTAIAFYDPLSKNKQCKGAPMLHILLDTDIGNDMDDMQALAYLLSQPDADILG